MAARLMGFLLANVVAETMAAVAQSSELLCSGRSVRRRECGRKGGEAVERWVNRMVRMKKKHYFNYFMSHVDLTVGLTGQKTV